MALKRRKKRKEYTIENSYDPNQWDNMLPTYYGATILEVVTKCFEDRANHG